MLDFIIFSRDYHMKQVARSAAPGMAAYLHRSKHQTRSLETLAILYSLP
jgi:hypothetical protein